jgi:effector-binding domain-containing protein
MKKSILGLAMLGLLLIQTPRLAAQSEAPNMAITEVQPFTYVCVPYKGPISDISKVIGTLMQAMGSQRLFPPGGPMIGVYYTAPGGSMAEMTWEIGFPVSAQANVLKPLEKKTWSFTTVATTLFVGPYDQAATLIPKLINWLMTQGYAPAGPVAERYLDMNPNQVKPADLRTEIWIPCRKLK